MKPKVTGKLKRFWIVKEKKTKVIKHLTWKEMESVTLITKLFFYTEEVASKYLTYLNTRKMEE